MSEGVDLTQPETALNAPISKVAKIIAKALKPGKQLISAVQFKNGKMEEVHESSFTVDELAEKRDKNGPHRTPAEPKDDKPARATTVAAPVRGCPLPDFPPARLRAREVLTMFLSPEQREDFEKYNRFIAVGGTTGHRYMITSRHALDDRFCRSLYDLDENRDICTHDYDVPPEEEMHALNILVQLPGHEGWMRELAE